MLSPLSSPIRSSNKLYNGSDNHHHHHHPITTMKQRVVSTTVSTVHPSPQSVRQSPYHSPTTTTTTITTTTMSPMKNHKNNHTTVATSTKTVEGQVSFRTATRRFSCHATMVAPVPTSVSTSVPVPSSTSSSSSTTIMTTTTVVPKTPKTTGPPVPKRKIQQSSWFVNQTTLPTIAPLEENTGSGTVIEAIEVVPVSTSSSSSSVTVAPVTEVTTTTTKRVQRDVSFRTLAQRFANTKKLSLTVPATPSIPKTRRTVEQPPPSPRPLPLPNTTAVPNTSSSSSSSSPSPSSSPSSPPPRSPEKQQRRNSTGYYDPRMAPSCVPNNTSKNSSTSISAATPVMTTVAMVSSPMRQNRRSSIATGCHETMNQLPSSPMPMITTSKIYYVPSSPNVNVNNNNPNEYLTNNKVFQKRYNTAAINIQRVYRGHVHRYIVAKIVSANKIQTHVRLFLTQRNVQKSNGATSIQRLFRGFAIRLRIQVYQLEYQLRQIEQHHVRELHEIQVKKEDEMKCMNAMIGQENVKYMQQSQQLQATIDEANVIIKYIRKENKKVRDKNDALRVAIQQLMDENEMLERQAMEYQEFASNMDQMFVLNHENVTLATIVTQFELRREQFADAIDRRDEFIMYENKIGRLYLNQIQQMVELVEETCTDPFLVAYIEELCYKCNSPGTGLESDDKMDMSER